ENQEEIRYITANNRGSSYFWTISGQKIAYVKDDNTPNVRYIDWDVPGYDTLTVIEVTDAHCIGYDTLVIKTAPYPIPSFTWSLPGASNIVKYENTTQQDSIWATTSEGTIVSEIIPYEMYWDFAKNTLQVGEYDMHVVYEDVHEPLLIGGYYYGYREPILRVVNSYGCESDYSEVIFVGAVWNLYVPTAFAPMNPAHGVRYFQPKGFNLESMEVYVFDLWGNIVWYSNEVENGNFVGKWDGTYDGKPLKSDMYIWKIEAVGVDGQSWKGVPDGKGGYNKYGSVMLLR